MSKVSKAKNEAVSPEAARKQTFVRWALVQTWYLRTLALGWLFFGLIAWSVIIGADVVTARPFEARATTFQAVTIYFAIVDILAAVGLWLLAPWGGVVWLIAAVSRLVIGFVFPAAHSMNAAGAAAIGACILTFMWLSWIVGRKARP
ncbi:MAG: DUF6163 family protein [Bosea sp. (in: a-proteobacteria)]